jgi:hypothetical protein
VVAKNIKNLYIRDELVDYKSTKKYILVSVGPKYSMMINGDKILIDVNFYLKK